MVDKPVIDQAKQTLTRASRLNIETDTVDAVLKMVKRTEGDGDAKMGQQA